MMSKREFIAQLIDGAWHRLAHGKPPYEHYCCRCGLRHKVEYKFEQGRVWERWTILDDEPVSGFEKRKTKSAPKRTSKRTRA